MAISSYDDIIAAFVADKGQDRFFSKTSSGILTAAGGGYSLWQRGTNPAAGSFGGTSAGVWTPQDASTVGALAFANPGGGDLLHLILAGITPTAASAGTLMIYDRLGQVEYLPLQDGSLPEVTAVTSDFTDRLAAGEGAQIFAEVTTGVMAGGPPEFSITSYTNQAGTAGRASQNMVGTAIASSAAGRFPYTNKWFIDLQAGDLGVRSIEEVTLTVGSSSAGCKMNIVAAKSLTFVPMVSSQVYVERDLVLATVKMPRIRDDACIAFAVLSASTNFPVFNGVLGAVAG